MKQPTGKYIVFYKYPRDIKNDRMNGSYNGNLNKFEGEIENFATGESNLCAFRNEEGYLLLVNYADIVQMSPITE